MTHVPLDLLLDLDVHVLNIGRAVVASNNDKAYGLVAPDDRAIGFEAYANTGSNPATGSRSGGKGEVEVAS